MSDVIVVECDDTILVVQNESTVVISDCVGVPGAPGPPGPPGGSLFYYEQNTPSNPWIINHGLNAWVHCTLMNDSHETIYADVVRTSLNTVTVSFAGPMTGSAELSP